jgi:predicted GNAT family N-acyltransferase
MSYISTLLSSKHHKAVFSCGKDVLDNYLHTQAKQDVKRKITACFVLTEDDNNIKGYYTLSSASLNRDELPPTILKKLPPAYQHLPTTLLGRLAIDIKYKGKGLGALLLMDALKRSYQNSLQIASMAVIVDPLDDEAKQFYKHYGFIELPTSGKMFIPMVQLETLFNI